MKKIKILIAILISLTFILTACTNGVGKESLFLTLSIKQPDATKSLQTNQELEFILSLNLPLANNELSSFSLEVNSKNGIDYTLTPDSTDGKFEVLNNKSVSIKYTPTKSGEYTFIGKYRLANSEEIKASKNLKIESVKNNNYIKDIRVLNGTEKNIENQEGKTYVIKKSEKNSASIKLDIELNDLGDPSLIIFDEDGTVVKKITDKEDLFNAFPISGKEDDLKKFIFVLYDSNNPNTNFENEDFKEKMFLNLIVSDDNYNPEITYMENTGSLEIVSGNDIKVETIADTYNLNFKVKDLKEFGNTGVYKIKASVVTDASTEQILVDKVFNYGERYEDTISLNLDTNISDQNIKIIAEDFIGNTTIENYKIKISKTSYEVKLQPKYLDGRALEVQSNRYVYEDDESNNKFINLIAEMRTNKNIEQDYTYSFEIFDGVDDKSLMKEDLLYQNRYTFPAVSLKEGENVFNLKAEIKDSENIVKATDNDTIRVYLEDKTPPKIKNAIITLNNSGKNFEINPPNRGNVEYETNTSWNFDINIEDTSEIILNTDTILGEILYEGQSVVNDPTFNYVLSENTLRISAPSGFNDTLKKGRYIIKIYRDSFGGNIQIQDENGNYLKEGQDYIIEFEVR
ncbi:hypothetical protein C7380_1251 [Oceanotoga teriensis]|uniref:Uncharacterized protein n=1 Tax=Oceanotoga teriensis TaxID=515440 RepID=A0AA45C4T3_9BACT|nr:hypothetical protein [Oceanotoga teriensis]PWJ87261.1 hypothetical protein C7380_1251 [Oceanotoga teriensis]